MPDEQGKLTVDELRDRWKTPAGKAFREEIIRQLQSDEKGHAVDWENLSVEVNGETHAWRDFSGVSEIKNFRELRGINLSELTLQNADLRYVHLEHSNLGGAHLEHSNLAGTLFKYATLVRTSLEHADLSLAYLEGANLVGAHLEGANLCLAQLEHANLWEANLEYANLSRASFEHADLSLASLEYANLNEANLEHANLMYANLEHSNLRHALLEGANLNYASFSFKSWRRVKDIIKYYWWLVKMILKKADDKPPDRLTLFDGAELKNVKLDSDPILYRDLLDEQYLDQFELKHKVMYPFWLVTSNCGRSASLVFLWSLVIIVFFGFIFSKTDFLYITYSVGEPPCWYPYYFSAVTMTTLGLASVEPNTFGAALWHTFENIIGYMWLGYLIAVLGAKFTRRSA
ncbi:pentapeptide repeat-containing protein [bacterium]|nr:pentapeptide repeat-containing protein [bacterium]